MAHDTLSRRHALKMIGGASSMSLFAASALAESALATLPHILQRPIPVSGEMLPILGFGTSRVVDVNKAEGKRRPLRQALKALFAAGGSVIDTAHNYNRSESVVGDLLTELDAQKKAFVSSKVYATSESEGKTQLDLSFRRLQRPVIDLYFVHNLVGLHTQQQTLLSYKEAGKIRYWGLSHFNTGGIDQIIHHIKSGMQPDFVQVPLSLAVPHAENTLLPLAAEKGIAVIANQPFAKGQLFRKTKGVDMPRWAVEMGTESWAQFFLKYITSHPSSNCVIPGTGRPDHALDNIKAGVGYMPTQAERQKMLHFWNSL